ncbi:MAG: isoamylase early set domain-containing protein [Chloroflexota bacterium]
MIQKKYVKSRDSYKITFKIPASELPEAIEVTAVSVVGSFNDWDPAANPMQLTKKGVFQTTIELAPHQSYQFRYLANGDKYFNAWQADGYIGNGLGEENCVINIEADIKA